MRVRATSTWFGVRARGRPTFAPRRRAAAKARAGTLAQDLGLHLGERREEVEGELPRAQLAEIDHEKRCGFGVLDAVNSVLVTTGTPW